MLEPQLYMDRARADLRASQVILGQSLYGVAVTRAYYAMFYAASALLASKGIARSKHSGVHSAFSEQFVKTCLIEVEYAKMLANAFDSRIDSDYDVLFTTEQALAEEVLEDARLFVDRAEQYLRQAGFL